MASSDRSEHLLDRVRAAEVGRNGPPAHESRFRFLNSDTFLAADYHPDWLVPWVLAKNQPGIIAGPSKGMKTSVLVDLAVSMATGTHFLGKWEVPERRRVAVVSGESGAHTLQDTCRRVLQAKREPEENLTDWLYWDFTLPRFSDLASMVDFANSLKALPVEAVLIDPVYLALGEIDARNLFEMGAALRVVAELLLKEKITPILAHHANRLLPTGEPMELQHLAYSGLEQFARQWILLNRNKKYTGDGNHELSMLIGGSAGHGSLNVLEIREGTVDKDFGGRTWEVAVTSFVDAIDNDRTKREAAKKAARLEAIQQDQAAVMLAIEAELASGRIGATERRIRDRTELSPARVKDAVGRLLDAQAILRDSWRQPGGNGAMQEVNGYRPIPEPSENNGLFES